MTDFKVECVVETHAEVGECPTWSVEDQCLYWIDIEGKAFHRFTPATGENRTWPLHAMPGAFVLTEDGGIIIAIQDGFYSFDCASGKATKLSEAPYDQNVIRFNDGKTDRQGRFWVTAQPLAISPESAGQGTLYRLDEGGLTAALHPIDIGNGLAFAADGRTVYRSESLQRKIFVSELDPETGRLGPERVFADTPGEGVPDGATVDSEGGYWAALALGGAIARFKPDGSLDFTIDLPVLVPTMPAFGGPDMTTLYVTTGRLEHYVGKEPTRLSGSVFAIETPFRGIAEARCKLASR